jgi:hypothetical protein
MFACLFALVAATVQLSVGAYGTGRSLTGDEASHFVNSLLVFDWLREAPLRNPMRFAQDYYQHLPRVTIGHWPPLFYVFQAGVFAGAGRSSAAALAFQAVIAGLAAGWPAALVQRRLGWLAGLATGVAVLASPDVMFLLDAVMVDTLLALFILASAVCWGRFASTGTVRWAVLFAATASSAILIKGNGFALAALPLLHAGLTRDMGTLRNPRAWLAAILVAITTLPWYALTWRIAAEGFGYGWGWDYTSHAVPAYATGIFGVIGAIAVVGFGAALWMLVRRSPEGRQDHELAAIAAAALAVFLFQLAAPAAITMRYLVALVPATMVVATVGLAELSRLVRVSPLALCGLATALLMLGNATSIFVPPHVSPFGMRAMARDLLSRDDRNPLVLVAADPRGEGALIAAFAEFDPGRTHWVLRATQFLARGGFMAQGYATRFSDAGAVRQWLAASGIGWLVVDVSGDPDTLEHHRQIVDAVTAAGWTPIGARKRPGGELRLYQLRTDAPSQAQMAALLSQVVPNTTGSLH